jgi:2-polyprenyl-3-methyl-5-hydroxy-6-metoxy-1,4-benzoquinol methylase
MTTITNSRALDTDKLDAFVGKALVDASATISATMIMLGDKLGLYRAMAQAGPVNSAKLAALSGTHERYIRDWLVNQAAGGYVDYDPASGLYSLSPEQTVALTDDTSPACVIGMFQAGLAATKAEPRMIGAFRTGNGLPWGEQDPDLFRGTQRLFRPGYTANVVNYWLPALDGVVEKLEKGATVADVGCGIGMSTIIMAKAFPNSRFVGFDNHAPSIELAQKEVKEAGVQDRVFFEKASATEYPGRDYDLIAFFDCFHDMGQPGEVIKYARQAIARDGVVLLVEPAAGEKVEDNFNPVGRFFSAGSTLCCLPNSIAGGGNPALGALATEQEIREVVLAGGFSQFRRAFATPVNRVFEVKP